MRARRGDRSRRALLMLSFVAAAACPRAAAAVVEWVGRDPIYTIDARVDTRRAEIDEVVEFALRLPARERTICDDSIRVSWPDSTEVRVASAPETSWRVDGRPVTPRVVPGGLTLHWSPADSSSGDDLTVHVQGRIRFRILPVMRFRNGTHRGVLLDEWFPAIACTRQALGATRTARHRLRVTVPARAGVVASGLGSPLVPDPAAPPGAWHACGWDVDSVAMVTVVAAEGFAVDADERVAIAGMPAVKDPGALRLAARRAVAACSTLYGPPPLRSLTVVVIPHALGADAATGPGVIILRGRGRPDGAARAALPHEVAHLWWGASTGAREDVGWFFEGVASYSRELAAQCAGAGRGTVWERLEGAISVLGWRALARSGEDRPLRGIAASNGDDASAVITYGKSLAFCRAVGDTVGPCTFALTLRDLLARVRGRTMEEADILAAVARAESISGQTVDATAWITGRVAPPARGAGARIVLTSPRLDDAGNLIAGAGITPRGRSPWRASAGVALSTAGEIPGWTARIARTWGRGLARVERRASTGRTEWTASATTHRSGALLSAGAGRRDDRSLPGAARAWDAGRTDAVWTEARVGGGDESATALVVRGAVDAPLHRAAGITWSIVGAHSRSLGGTRLGLALAAQAVGGDPLVQDLADAHRLGILRARGPGRVPSRTLIGASVDVSPRVVRPLHAYASIARLHGAVDAHATTRTAIPRDPTIAEAGIGLALRLVDPLPHLVVEAPLWTTGRLPGARVRVQVTLAHAAGFPREPMVVVR